MESVREYGVLTPAIARPRESGDYEIVSGHRRKHASELSGADALPAIIREMDDDAAVILLVDSNIQREKILPSEGAPTYEMRTDMLKRRAGRHTGESEDNLPQVAANYRLDKEVAKVAGIGGDSVVATGDGGNAFGPHKSLCFQAFLALCRKGPYLFPYSIKNAVLNRYHFIGSELECYEETACYQVHGDKIVGYNQIEKKKDAFYQEERWASIYVLPGVNADLKLKENAEEIL